MCESVDGKDGDDESTLHVQDARTERPPLRHAKGHLLDRPNFVHGVQVSEDQNLTGPSPNPRPTCRIWEPDDPQVIACVLSWKKFDFRSAHLPFRR